MKAYPKVDDIKKRMKRSANSSTDIAATTKKPRVEAAPLSSTETPPVTETGIDVTEQFIVERLTPELAADLVITAMVRILNTNGVHAL